MPPALGSHLTPTPAPGAAAGEGPPPFEDPLAFDGLGLARHLDGDSLRPSGRAAGRGRGRRRALQDALYPLSPRCAPFRRLESGLPRTVRVAPTAAAVAGCALQPGPGQLRPCPFVLGARARGWRVGPAASPLLHGLQLFTDSRPLAVFTHPEGQAQHSWAQGKGQRLGILTVPWQGPPSPAVFTHLGPFPSRPIYLEGLPL